MTAHFNLLVFCYILYHIKYIFIYTYTYTRIHIKCKYIYVSFSRPTYIQFKKRNNDWDSFPFILPVPLRILLSKNEK